MLNTIFKALESIGKGTLTVGKAAGKVGTKIPVATAKTLWEHPILSGLGLGASTYFAGSFAINRQAKYIQGITSESQYKLNYLKEEQLARRGAAAAALSAAVSPLVFKKALQIGSAPMRLPVRGGRSAIKFLRVATRRPKTAMRLLLDSPMNPFMAFRDISPERAKLVRRHKKLFKQGMAIFGAGAVGGVAVAKQYGPKLHGRTVFEAPNIMQVTDDRELSFASAPVRLTRRNRTFIKNATR